MPPLSGVTRARRWVCEEFGGVGAQQYFQAHKDEVTHMLIFLCCYVIVVLVIHLQISNMSVAFEADLGVFKPLVM